MQQDFKTERLSLALLQPGDHMFVLELVNSEGWLRFIGDRSIHNAADAITYVQRIMATPQLFYWVVRENSSGAPVGIVSFLKRAYLEAFDIGFAFLPHAGGKGYAQEAAAAVLEAALPVYGPVLAVTKRENMRSIRLLEKLGLSFREDRLVNDETVAIFSTAS